MLPSCGTVAATETILEAGAAAARVASSARLFRTVVIFIVAMLEVSYVVMLMGMVE